jgi:Holliday junction DNA helicase RuvB
MARPLKTFNDFVGQRRVIAYLTRLIEGAKSLGKVCPSLLLVAPSGAGKTTFANAIATEYGSNMHGLHAGETTRAGDLCKMLSELAYGDVFFIDESHSLHRDAQQVLYIALDRAKIPVFEEGRLNRSRLASIANFTLLLATNTPGQLMRGIRTRLARIEFDRYGIEELKVIAEQVATQENLAITPQAARRLAEVAQHVPRRIQIRIEHLRLYHPGVDKITLDHVEALLRDEGIDARGLTPHQRLFLTTLAEAPRHACTLERLSVKLGCDPADIRQEVEPFLIDQGLVEPHSGRGRTLTAAGLVEVQAINTDSITLIEQEV